MDKARESRFQHDILQSLLATGWRLGESSGYDRVRALYPEDLLGFVRDSQPQAWEKFCQHYPQDPQTALLDSVAAQLGRADPNATAKELRRYGTLGVLRHELKDRGVRLRLCQFKPDHAMNPQASECYRQNRLRVVPELVYSPHGYDGRLDLALFVNGVPVATLELKSEFKQAVDNAVRQYRHDRPPQDPKTGKPEPLLTFKRGALVHFAVSQHEVRMSTRLAGADTVFLPFNRGTRDGGAGNDVPEGGEGYATAYLWEEVLHPDNLLAILGRFVHLQVEEKEDWDGRKLKRESLIFPRYHQWDVVRRLLAAVRREGPGQKYLIQHSAGSGKSNSIAWTVHQLASLYDPGGSRLFASVIVVTDRTVLDAQLQDTIYQFEHAEGVVGRISREDGDGAKSEQLAQALEAAQPIIVVTLQTFPYVLEAIQRRADLKQRRFAVIADEAHSSQTGSTARKLREVLLAEKLDADEEAELSAEDMLDLALEARRGSPNVSYFAFTATPKPKTLELFGRLPDPALPPSADNKPQAFHVYSMRQAIEEGFIFDVLKNYVNYRTAYRLAQRHAADEQEVDSKQAVKALGLWVKLHGYNVGQRVRVIVEHFRQHVQPLLNGQAKAMVVTSSRKEAVRYKLAFDRYLRDQGYRDLQAMVAFSGEVEDPESGQEAFNERNMNPGLKGRDLRKAFDTAEYHVMIVANKFQTGFDQPKLCAMYVLKKLADVDCVQTLSRLNRTYPGKNTTFVLDFVNDPDDVLAAFLPYYTTAALSDVSDPNLVYRLFDRLRDQDIFQWHEVEAFVAALGDKKAGQDKLANLIKPAVDRWKRRYQSAQDALKEAERIRKHAKASGDAVLVANAETSVRACKDEKGGLEIFKKNLGEFSRYYEFMSQIVVYDDRDLEKLNLYARHLRPLLREDVSTEEAIDLGNIVMTHYRLAKAREQDLKLTAAEHSEHLLDPVTDLGSKRVREQASDLLSHILQRMNDIFASENLSESDLLSYATTIADKVRENERVMQQIRHNSLEQAMLGDFPTVLEDAVVDSMVAHQDLAMQFLASKEVQRGFAALLLSMLRGGAQ